MRCRPRTGDFYTIKGLLVFSCVSHFWKLFGPSGRRARRVGSRDGTTPAVAVDSEGLRDGRHQCFEVGAWICFSDVYVGRLYGDSPVAGRRSPIAGRRSPVRRLADVPICCVERWNLIRRLAGRRSPVAGTPLRWCTNLLCWTFESDTPNDGNRFACVRRFAGVRICCVGRLNLIRRMMVIDSPVYANSPVYQSVVLNVGIWYSD